MDETKAGQWSADSEVSSRSRLDDPLVLQRKLRDNASRYEVEPVGMIRTTHRYRGRKRGCSVSSRIQLIKVSRSCRLPVGRVQLIVPIAIFRERFKRRWYASVRQSADRCSHRQVVANMLTLAAQSPR